MLTRKYFGLRLVHCLGALAWSMCLPAGAALEPGQLEFFESKIRPVLAQECYECHSTQGKQKGGLVLDHREGLHRGGDSGATILPGDPGASLLLKAIRHSVEDLKMPKNGAKLEPAVVADFEKWIQMGAPDPRDHPPNAAELAKNTDWPAVRERRKSWWSFQPIREAQPPATPNQSDARPIDRFISAALRERNLTSSAPATRDVLIRRLSFNIRGLPPAPAEITTFLNDEGTDAYERLVDAFLASPEFGERWARHWMDWLRYADSHGSEGDPMIPNAWRYRDYLIRALNADVPVDQLIREHLAGDLLENPRINADLGLNESAIGPAHLRMVFHGFAPTDALDELVKFTDDQVNVVSKAFMGLTVSCARCHDHKFDPISQADFYAWFGVMASGRPAMVRVDVPAKVEEDTRQQMTALRKKIGRTMIDRWLAAGESLGERLLNPAEPLAKAIEQGEKNELLWPLALIGKPEKFAERWRKLSPVASRPATNDDLAAVARHWRFGAGDDTNEWFSSPASRTRRLLACELVISDKEDKVIASVLPSGVYSHGDSTKDIGVLHSSRIELDGTYDLWLRMAGDGNAMARYSVQSYPRDGTVYPVERLRDGQWRWKKFPLDYWKGDRIHFELTTAADQALLADGNAARSWFGIREALLVKNDAKFAPAQSDEALALLAKELTDVPSTREQLAAAYQRAAANALHALRDGRINDAQAVFLDQLLRQGLLPNTSQEVPSVAATLAEYRRLEASLSVPLRAPGILETTGFDQPLYERGDHRKPRDPVPRRFLEAIDAKPYQTKLSGRRELAEDLLRADNPLTARVMVNHVWHHLFGRGIVSTPDNFGRLGQPPSHPELLDYLAFNFRKHGWSMKQLVREIVLTETWRRSSEPSPAALAADPDDVYLSHYPVRRLEAEAIRDAILTVSGQLEREARFGPAVLGNVPRRSVYVRVKRNDLDPFLTQFDAPVPASGVGVRDDTNVPGQSLTLLNDPFILRAAESWVNRIGSDLDRSDLVQSMFQQALGRGPTSEESAAALAFMADMKAKQQTGAAKLSELKNSLEQLQTSVASVESAARQRVLASRETTGAKPASVLPKPAAAWDFSKDLADQVGGLAGTATGRAKLADGQLVLDGRESSIATAPLPFALRAKTLEAWVKLDGLDQQGGGVMTVQTLDGGVFDAIVFGEQERRQWIAGSDVFIRTKALGGPAEQAAQQEFIQVAVTYADDGTITFYRNGKPHGKSYRSSPPVHFEVGKAQVLFGNRHGSPSGNRLLKGKITRARLYDRALSAAEVAANFSDDPNFVSAEAQWAALTPNEQGQLKDWRQTIERLEQEMKELTASPGLSSPAANLAHAMFNLKEFIYIR
jgi:Protein of unknown function (DUF1553)/Protein of unknown function (DUF1549)/Concanavalin A-like lectin/glucanases superfamily/Planctomycete cytochrome C